MSESSRGGSLRFYAGFKLPAYLEIYHRHSTLRRARGVTSMVPSWARMALPHPHLARWTNAAMKSRLVLAVALSAGCGAASGSEPLGASHETPAEPSGNAGLN